MDRLHVSAAGTLEWRGKTYRCALGTGGVRPDKHEGDGATPAGTFPLREVLFRSDRVAVATKLPARALAQNDGWCDAGADPHYNKPVLLPYPASAENLWRDDHLYDVIVVVGYNDDPPVPGKGSAIFIHIAREGYSPTAGCIALDESDLLEILAEIGREATISIDT